MGGGGWRQTGEAVSTDTAALQRHSGRRAQELRQAYQLNGGEVLLPPQVLLVVGAHGSQTVVSVHDDMDHTV